MLNTSHGYLDALTQGPQDPLGEVLCFRRVHGQLESFLPAHGEFDADMPVAPGRDEDVHAPRVAVAAVLVMIFDCVFDVH